MLKNIQKYLLLNYPLIWNIKVFPVLGGAILVNLLLYLLGYGIQSVDFSNDDYDNSHFLIYFFIIIVVILSIIFWLVNYSKNNAIKSFYPTSRLKLYIEWILIFLCVLSIVVFPFSFYKGTNNKIQSYATLEELAHAAKILNTVKILMPSADSKMDYFQEKPTENSRYNNYSMKNPNSNRNNYYNNRVDSMFDNNEQVYYSDYPNFTQFSLLNYSNNNFISFDDSEKYKGSPETVKQWLVEGKTDSIKYLMSEYLKLESSKNLLSNITVDKWFSKIYNPPTFKIDESSFFDVPYFYYNDYYDSNNTFFYNNLKSGYRYIYNAHDNNSGTIFLTLLYISLGMSILIFSFRITSGKTWLISMISIGLIGLILVFLTTLLSLIRLLNEDYLNPFSFYGFLVIALFCVELSTVVNRESKGKSGILLNHVIGLLPIIPLVLLNIVTPYLSHSSQDYIYQNIYYFGLINFILTFFTMSLLIRFVLIRWKGLPEE